MGPYVRGGDHLLTCSWVQPVVIDEMIHAELVKDTMQKKSPSAHVESFCATIISRKDKGIERNNGAGNASLQRVGTRGLTRHLSRASPDHQTAKHHFRKAQNNSFEGCADGWEKDADDRKCMQGIAARTKPWTVPTTSQVGLRKNPQHCPAANAGAIREPVECCANYCCRIQYDTHTSTS